MAETPNPQQNQPAQPTPQPITLQTLATAQAGTQPGQKPGVPAQAVTQPAIPAAPAKPGAPSAGGQGAGQKPGAPTQPSVKPGTPLPKDQGKSNKKLVIGCLSAFGCSLFLFLGVLFAFLAFGSNDNPIFGFLGGDRGEVVNTLITLVNLIFLFLVFVAFILVIVGVFKISTARKDDKEAKKRGTFFTLVSLGMLTLLVFVWIFAYFFLASKRTPIVRTAITTQPEKTTNLTAPIRVEFDASKAPISSKFEILSYNWDFADGEEAVGKTQAHTFTEVGNFKVKLTIVAKEKSSGKEEEVLFEKDVTIANVQANVVIKADKKTGGAPLTINLDGSESSSPNGEITAFAWDLDEDGTFDDGNEETAQTTFDKIGTYKVRLRVTDSKGEFSTGEQEIEVTPPDAPVAVITVEDVTGTELLTNTNYVFTGASSVSPTGKIEKYSWDFGDTGKASTRTASHIYKDAGEYEIVLTVIDSAKKKGETAQRFTVKAPDAPPLVSLKTTPPAKDSVITGEAPFDVIFDASASQDPNNDIVDYSWDFDGDGKMDDANAVTSYQFKNAGTFNVSLTVTDSANLSTKSQVVMQVAAAGLKSIINAEPMAGVVPLTVKFDASGSAYPDGKIVSYEWDFGDGKPPRTDSSKVTYQYTSIGTFVAKVSAIAQDNKRATAEVNINVRPVSVKACFEPSVSSGASPLQVEFDPTCSTGTVVKYRWNFANLGNSTDRKAKFTFKDPGEYTVTLEVADSQNVLDTFTKTITVEASK